MTQDDRFTGIDEAVALPALLGYLNFSEGRPDPRFQKQIHDAFAFLVEHGSVKPWEDLRQLLIANLQTLQHAGSAAFADTFMGFGNLVILDHGAQAYTLYGDLLDVLVSRGGPVERGQIIGHVGQAPAGGPGLYFELRIDGRPADPLQWLKPR